MEDFPPYFHVTKVKWSSSNIQYAVLFLSDRMLFVRTGGQFTGQSKGSMIGAIAGGVLGGAVGGLLASEAGRKIEEKLKKDSVDPREKKVASLADIPSDELLRLDKKNFQILYSQVKQMELKKSAIGVNGPRSGSISIESHERKKDSFDITPGQDYDYCATIVRSFLADKIK